MIILKSAKELFYIDFAFKVFQSFNTNYWFFFLAPLPNPERTVTECYANYYATSNKKKSVKLFL